jgi:hypothetical protein
MKLITRRAFKLLEGEVLFSKYSPMIFEGFEIKLENCGNNDWVTDPIRPDNIMNEGSEDMYLKLDIAEQLKDDPNAPHLPMDFDYSGRDGLYEDDDSLIAIYDEADILKLAERLVRLLPNHELVLKAPESEITRMRKIHSDAVIDPDAAPKTMEQYVEGVEKFLTKDTPADPARCADDVYKHGVSLGFHDMTKDEAEAWCIEQTKVTGRKHDWHYVGGRVHIKAMPEVKESE